MRMNKTQIRAEYSDRFQSNITLNDAQVTAICSQLCRKTHGGVQKRQTKSPKHIIKKYIRTGYCTCPGQSSSSVCSSAGTIIYLKLNSDITHMLISLKDHSAVFLHWSNGLPARLALYVLVSFTLLKMVLVVAQQELTSLMFPYIYQSLYEREAAIWS